MSQPFPNHGSTGSGRSSSRRPIVLARIPHVGEPVGVGAKHAPVGPTASASAASSQPSALPQGTRYFVDSQHTFAVAAEPPTRQHAQQQWETELRTTSLGHHRHHGAHAHHQSDAAMVTDSPPPIAEMGLSRLHGEVNSYAGMIVTLVLMASGFLLYWILVAPGQTPVMDYNNSLETVGSIKIEIPEFDSRDDSHVGNQRTSQNALTALPEPRESVNNELIRLPEDTAEQSIEEEPVFNDASAWSFPSTGRQQVWAPSASQGTDTAGEDGPVLLTEPETAQRPKLPTPSPFNR